MGFFNSLFETNRDYKCELQGVVDRYPMQTAGLNWVFADYNDVEQTNMFSRVRQHYFSYVVAFGGNNLTIIPIIVSAKTILSDEPILANIENIQELMYSKMSKMTKIKILNRTEEIQFNVIPNPLRLIKASDIVSQISERAGYSLDDYGFTNSSVTIEQKQNQSLYADFITRLIKEIHK